MGSDLQVCESTTMAVHAQTSKTVPMSLAGLFQSFTMTSKGGCISCKVLQNGHEGIHLR